MEQIADYDRSHWDETRLDSIQSRLEWVEIRLALVRLCLGQFAMHYALRAG